MKQKVKSFKFRFSALIYFFIVAALLLSAAGVGLTIWRILAQGGGPLEWLQHGIMLFVAGLLAVLVSAALVKSEYILTAEEIILAFGFIKTKYDLKTIRSVHLFRGAGKLTVYFDDYKNDHAIINIKEERYDDFVQTLLELNPKIGFSFSSPEEEEDIKKGK